MPHTYDNRPAEVWMDGLKEFDEHNTRHLLSLFGLLGIPESYMDVGCGTGIMVNIAKKLGVRSYGLDQLVPEDGSWGESFIHMNLVDYWKAPEPVDIVTCIEVAEHIHHTAHATLCKTLCDNIKKGPGHYLIFSAARPGQAGAGHIACRPLYEWHNEMIVNEMHFDKETTMNLALLWSNTRSSLDYMWDNLQVFTR